MTFRHLLATVSAGLLLSLTSAALAQTASDYRVVITNVDSSRFPTVHIEFQVFAQNPNVDPWDPASSPVRVQELLPTSAVPAEATDAQVVDPIPCEVKPVLMAVAVDTSGSLAGVIDNIKEGVVAVFEELDNSPTEDRAAMYTFDSGRKFRFPEETASDLYTDQGTQIAQDPDFQDLEGGGASPIWEGMDAELERLLQYVHPDPEVTRVLVSFTDGMDNQSTPEDMENLLNKARRGGAILMNMGYADQNSEDLRETAEASGGAYMEGLDTNIRNAMLTILNSVRNTYCLEYTSPHADVVNEPATVIIESGSAMGSARYPLPFVIPEDSTGVQLFFPVSQFMYEGISAGGDPPSVAVTMALRDAYGNPWQPVSPGTTPDRRPEDKGLTFEVPPDAWVADEGDPDDLLDGEFGFTIAGDQITSVKDSEGTDVPDANVSWDQLFRVPTDYVDLDPGLGNMVIEGVDHFLIRAELVLTGFAPGAGKKYPSSTRLSVQDRTPPHVLVKLQPQDGGPLLQLVLREQEVDQDPAMVAGRPSSADVHVTGTGEKRASLAYHWRDEEGQAAEGQLDGQHWSLWRERPDPDFPSEMVPTAVFRDGSDQAMGGSPVDIFRQGVRIPPNTRIQIEILARDNYALIKEARAPEDQEVWTEDEADWEESPLDGVTAPRHAHFDLNRFEAQPEAPEAPFLPHVAHEDLEADLSEPGVSWWIHSPHDDRDRFQGLEWLSEVMYPYSDEDARQSLARAGITVPPGEPVRYLRIRAQDGQGNVTLADIPIQVGEGSFGATALEYDSRRDRRW